MNDNYAGCEVTALWDVDAWVVQADFPTEKLMPFLQHVDLSRYDKYQHDEIRDALEDAFPGALVWVWRQ